MPALNLTQIEAKSKSRTPIEDIDRDLIDTLEEAYAVGDPNARFETPSLGTKDDAEEWLHDARSYVYHRKDTDGRLVVSGNATKAGQVRFRIYDFVE